MYVNYIVEKNRPYLAIQKIYITINGLFQKKATPHDGRHAEKFSQEGQLTALEIHTGGGL